VEEFTYLGTTLRNQNVIQEQIKSRLKSVNACHHLVQNLTSSSLLSKNIKIEIYRRINLPFVLYGCETWLFTLREEHWLKVFENRVLRGIFWSKRDKVTGEWRKLHNEEIGGVYCCMVCTTVWSVPLHGLYRRMVCTAIWSVPPNGLYCLMVCTAHQILFGWSN
jgi:hypothetical protein